MQSIELAYKSLFIEKYYSLLLIILIAVSDAAQWFLAQEIPRGERSLILLLR